VSEELTKERLFTMMAGYKSTAVLRAAIELGLFDALTAGPLSTVDIAARLGVTERALAPLLASATGIGLLSLQDNGYALPPGAAELLVSTSPGYSGGITRVAASDMEWDALGQLASTIRRGTPVVDALAPDFPYWVDFATHTTFLTDVLAGVVADALGSLATQRDPLSVLDVGCGHGIFGFTLAQRYPSVRVVAQDWPGVLAVAEQHAKRRGVADRVSYLPGDAYTVDLAGRYDVIVLANVLFHFPPERVAALLRRLAGVLAPDGRLVVAGFTSGDRPPAEEAHAALLGLLMLSTTGGGRMYSTVEYERMLAGAGLVHTEVYTRPKLLPRVIVAGRTPLPG
jgi:C-methyltransferase